MVGGEDDQGVWADRGDQSRERLVGVMNFSTVGVSLPGCVLDPGRVWVIEMNPAKAWTLDRFPPPYSGVDDLGAGKLHFAKGSESAHVLGMERIAIDLEALVETPGSVQDIGADKGPGLVALNAHGFGQGVDLIGQTKARVVSKAVLSRELAGEQRRVRRQGQGSDGVCLSKEHAAGRQAIDDRGSGLGVAVGTHSIGSQGVDGDEQNVGRTRVPCFHRRSGSFQFFQERLGAAAQDQQDQVRSKH